MKARYNRRPIPLLQEDQLQQPVKRQLLPERFLQEHDEQRIGTGGGGGGAGTVNYPGVEEPILDFLASPAIREEGGQAARAPADRNLPTFSTLFRPIYFSQERASLTKRRPFQTL